MYWTRGFVALSLNPVGGSSSSSVGVPGGPERGHQHGRPPVGGALHPAPRLRGLWRGRVLRPQTHPRELERRRLPHQLQHQGYAGGGRLEVRTRRHFVVWRLFL